MMYSVAFQGLPFEPGERQVVYIENQYDERINAIIRERYEQLRWIFKRVNLDFVYLPMFFKDEETKEKVLYYAPYLTADIIQKAELRSSYLLNFLCQPESSEKMTPSLIYAPKKDGDKWVFQRQLINIDKYGIDDCLEWFQALSVQIMDELLYVKHNRPRNFESQINYASMPSKSSHWDYYLPPGFLGCALTDHEMGIDNIGDVEPAKDESISTLDEIREEDVRDTIEELERNIERLRLYGVPLTAIVEFVSKYETVSRLRITDDLRIFLPDYNNREVKIPALYKAVYFLFLNHPEGIVLKQMENYHSELANYYKQTSGAECLTPRMINSLNHLEAPGGDAIQVALSKIKIYFKGVIDEHLARHYCIVGSPSEPYKIPLDNSLIEWVEEK